MLKFILMSENEYQVIVVGAGHAGSKPPWQRPGWVVGLFF